MRVLVDENIPRLTVEALRLLGHDVLDIRGSDRQGAPDPDLWGIALAEERTLITTDKCFTEYRFAAPSAAESAENPSGRHAGHPALR
jgi:predicted nuclease of predicted toxin-antitoxin system